MNKIIILVSVYNDWKSAFKLLEKIDNEIANWSADVLVLIINDASTEKRPKTELNLKNIKSLRVMNMKENRGHARCNAAGLKYLSENENFDYVILMDGDGEDRPEELGLLLSKSKENPLKTITANRISRSEGIFFKFLYMCHKILTYLFTGKLIRFGNYSLLPKAHAIKLVKESCIWSSFTGSVTKILSERISVPSIRGKRYFGPSKMNFFNLLLHSFSIIAVFRYSVIFRSILFLIFYLFFALNYLSFFTLLPAAIIIVFTFTILIVSFRENTDGLKNSLNNIDNIDTLINSNNR